MIIVGELNPQIVLAGAVGLARNGHQHGAIEAVEVRWAWASTAPVTNRLHRGPNEGTADAPVALVGLNAGDDCIVARWAVLARAAAVVVRAAARVGTVAASRR